MFVLMIQINIINVNFDRAIIVAKFAWKRKKQYHEWT
ncbi:MAG: hypothetical protein PWR03_461 [Tenuifilum sp.]|jgi:hypothetical protein|nr:hypothetical protein [Tenuifilum sp.]